MESLQYIQSLFWELRVLIFVFMALFSEYKEILISFILLYQFYIYNASSTHYFYAPSDLNKRIVDSLRQVEFKPGFVFTNRIFSHVVTEKLSSICSIPEYDKIITEGGASLALTDKPSKHVVIVVPGIAANEKSKYLQDIVLTLRQQGFCPAVYYNRFLSGYFKYPEKYLCLSSDILDAIKLLKSKYPKVTLMTAAASYGGVQMLNYLAEINNKVEPKYKIQAAISFGTPFDLKHTERTIRGSVFGKALFDFLVEVKENNRKAFGNGSQHIKINWNEIDSVKNLRELDDSFITKCFNLRNAEEYYDWISPYNRVLNIDIPTVLYQSRDDAIAPPEVNPLREVSVNKNLIVVETDHGGHLTYLEGINGTKPKVAIGRICAKYFNTII